MPFGACVTMRTAHAWTYPRLPHNTASMRRAQLWTRIPCPLVNQTVALESTMPLFVYHCQDCDRSSEVLRHSSEEGPVHCPHCDSTAMHREFATFSVGSSQPANAMPCGGGDPAACPGGACPFAN
ncbi:MAG: zinc ribbon domain-containing protein [Planctomycetota bacterium]|nr:MAG: zinc ribbon domain-containing protein [Planctomycetota bacterium]